MTGATLTRAGIGARIALLPSAQRDTAIQLLRQFGPALERKGARRTASRTVAERRKYAHDPFAYFADVQGITLSPDQETIVDMLRVETRVLLPSANNMGKTFIIAAWGVYLFDARASLPDEDSGQEEQGCKLLLPGPDHPTIKATIYNEMLALAARAEHRGFLMPGERSDRSVLWQVRPKWDIEPFSPQERVNQAVAHKASGRHHRNQAALIEEGQGVPEATWKAVEGMCSAAGNQIVSSFNPTEPVGPTFVRAGAGTYKVFHISAFNHPNVLEREYIIKAAIDYKVIDARVKDCRDRGPYPATPLDPAYHDFVYALPPVNAIEEGPRNDGIMGHPFGTPRVYRPTAAFTAQVLGQFPSESNSGLFNAADIDASMARWQAGHDPVQIPDRVGTDPSRRGGDDALAAPSWGPTGEALLRTFADCETQGASALALLRARTRIRVGEMTVFPKGDGVDLAMALDRKFPGSPFIVDEGGVGSSPYDHLNRVLGRVCLPVSFAASPLPPVPSEPWCENTRTQLYVRLAMLLQRGLIDLPPDPLLREELLAHYVLDQAKTVEQLDPRTNLMVKSREPSVALVAKDVIKKLIGRSPDRADGCVLSVYNRAFAPTAIVHTTFRTR